VFGNKLLIFGDEKLVYQIELILEQTLWLFKFHLKHEILACLVCYPLVFGD